VDGVRNESRCFSGSGANDLWYLHNLAVEVSFGVIREDGCDNQRVSLARGHSADGCLQVPTLSSECYCWLGGIRQHRVALVLPNKVLDSFHWDAMHVFQLELCITEITTK
jgi:hypothetical protein